MSFHYSQGPAAVYSAQHSSGTGTSAMSSGTSTAKKSLPKESKTESLTKPQSSVMSVHSPVKGTPKRIREWLTSLPRVFHANPLVLRESAKEKKITGICGPQPRMSSGLSSHDPFCWKMCREYAHTCPWSSETCVALAMMFDDPSSLGLTIAEHHTSGSESGLWHTPRAHENSESSESFVARNADRGMHCFSGLTAQVKAHQEMLPTPDAWDGKRGPGAVYDKSSKKQCDRTLVAYALKGGKSKKGWRTPTAHDWKNTGCCNQTYLSDQVRPEQVKNERKLKELQDEGFVNNKFIPTPRATDGIVRHSKRWMLKRIQENRDVDLTTAVKMRMFPTPNTMEGMKPKPLAKIVAHNQKARPGRSYLNMNLREEVVYGSRNLDGTPKELFPTPNMMDGLRTGKETNLNFWRHSAAKKKAQGINKQKPLLISVLEKEEQKKQMIPTPNCSDGRGANMKDGHDLKKGYLRGFVQVFPTPKATEHKGGYSSKDGSPSLGRMAKTGEWIPTPVSYDATPGGPNNHYKGLGWHAKHGKKFPTPVSGCIASGKKGSKSQIHHTKRGHLAGTVATEESGQLNPDWVEALMGWPPGWTSLQPMSKETFYHWVQYHQWEDWEPPISRVMTSKKKDCRVERLTAIGNGQVPIVVMASWMILTRHLQRWNIQSLLPEQELATERLF